VPAGEQSKSLEYVGKIYSAALASGLDRKSLFVALGGGMIGDLTGFAAATFLRGVNFIQVPTTLLAMVDSSVGGKTGINLKEGKNLAGAFHQPLEVNADIDCLTTLNDREYRSGLAEVVKYGVIWDASLFHQIETQADAIIARNADVLSRIIARCCEIKAEVVAVDERDNGVRSILNFGHTMGHALETASGYGTLLHGEAVAVGMVFAASVSVAEKGFSKVNSDRLRNLLVKLGLPVTCNAALSWDTVRKAMNTDKKSQLGKPRFVLAEKLGAVLFGCEASEHVMEEAFCMLKQN
jgi:3-dehydroquinate synthase